MFDNIFNKKNQEENNPPIVEEKPKAEMPDAVRNALENVLPDLVDNIENIAKLYPTKDDLYHKTENASVEHLLIICEYLINLANELQKIEPEKAKEYSDAIPACFRRVQDYLMNAEEVYAIVDMSLPRPYPYIVDGEMYLFFDKSRANQWASFLSSQLNNPVAVSAVAKKDVPHFFGITMCTGTEYMRFEPAINNIHIKINQIFNCKIDTVADVKTKYFMLNYLQLTNTKNKEEQKQTAYNTMLGVISANKFLVAGIVDGDKFSSYTIADQEKKIWVPVFTDIAEFKTFISVNEDINKQFSKAELKVMEFRHLRDFLTTPNLVGIVINPSDIGIRIPIDLCKAMMDNADKIVAEQNKQ